MEIGLSIMMCVSNILLICVALTLGRLLREVRSIRQAVEQGKQPGAD